MHGHHRRMMVRRYAMRRGAGSSHPRRGRGWGRGAMMRGFLDENPECAEKMLRYGVAQMRDEDFSDEEIRAHFEEMRECGHFGDVDIDHILG